VGSEPRADCSRAAVAVWIRKLNVSTSRAEDDSTPPSADESMLDWLVTFCAVWLDSPGGLGLFFSDFRGSIVIDDL
jgi:hypothetical protein